MSMWRKEPLLSQVFFVVAIMLVAYVLSGEVWFFATGAFIILFGLVLRRTVVPARQIRQVRIEMAKKEAINSLIQVRSAQSRPSGPPHIHLPTPVVVRTGPQDEFGQHAEEIVNYVCADMTCQKECDAGQQTEDGHYYVVVGDTRWERDPKDPDAPLRMTYIGEDPVDETLVPEEWEEAFPDHYDSHDRRVMEVKRRLLELEASNEQIARVLDLLRERRVDAAHEYVDRHILKPDKTYIFSGDLNQRAGRHNVYVGRKYGSDHQRMAVPDYVCANCGGSISKHLEGHQRCGFGDEDDL